MAFARPRDCPKCGAPAVEQVRGEMGPGDYWQDRDPRQTFWPHGPWKMTVKGPVKEPFHTLLEIDPSNMHDRRIACSSCNKATGWSNGSFVKLIGEWNNGA